MLIKKYLFLFLLPLLITCGNKNNNQNDNSNKQHININTKQVINDYQSFFDQYNSLINYEGTYYVQLVNSQKLINEIEQHVVDLVNASLEKGKNHTYDQIINKHCTLLKKAQHKQKWLINNHLGYGYLIIASIQLLLTIIIFIWYLDLDHNNQSKWLDKIKVINSIYNFLFDKLAIKGKITNRNVEPNLINRYKRTLYSSYLFFIDVCF